MHTPTPWTCRKDHHTWSLNDEHEVAIATMDGNNDKEDAQLIVRACNAHDELVEALEKIRDLMSSGPAATDIAIEALAKAKGE